MSEEQKLKEPYESDLRDLVDTYRTLKNTGKWIAGIFAFLLVLASILLTLKELLKK